MSPRGIALYCARALIFAAAVCGAYALVCRLRRQPVYARRLLAVGYIAALIEITVIRGGVDFGAVLRGGREAPQLIPLRTTLGGWSAGWWSFLYHLLGNLAWFAPLGLLLRRRSVGCALAAGAALSACIELSQYLLMTGMADIDDVLLNTLGAALGWLAGRGMRRGRA